MKINLSLESYNALTLKLFVTKRAKKLQPYFPPIRRDADKWLTGVEHETPQVNDKLLIALRALIMYVYVGGVACGGDESTKERA